LDHLARGASNKEKGEPGRMENFETFVLFSVLCKMSWEDVFVLVFRPVFVGAILDRLGLIRN
jgi:hypothetical protein